MNLGRALPDTSVGRQVAKRMRSILARLRRTPIDTEVLGQRMRLHTAGNAGEKRLLVTPQYFDPVELTVLAPRITPGFVFLDIGANAGTYSLFVARRAGPSAVIIAVEPNPVMLDRLRFNLAANGLDHVRVRAIGLSDQPGSATFSVNHRNMGNSSLRGDVNAARHRRSAITIEVDTLAALVAREGLARIDAIKADVEGLEDKILLPFFESAPEALWPSLVILERSYQWERDCVAGLIARGYRLDPRSKSNAILLRG
jgi:FkbM family methyltransferase